MAKEVIQIPRVNHYKTKLNQEDRNKNQMKSNQPPPPPPYQTKHATRLGIILSSNGKKKKNLQLQKHCLSIELHTFKLTHRFHHFTFNNCSFIMFHRYSWLPPAHNTHKTCTIIFLQSAIDHQISHTALPQWQTIGWMRVLLKKGRLCCFVTNKHCQKNQFDSQHLLHSRVYSTTASICFIIKAQPRTEGSTGNCYEVKTLNRENTKATQAIKWKSSVQKGIAYGGNPKEAVTEPSSPNEAKQ